MTTFEFRPPVRENVPLLLGVAGGTGSGKTYSALRIARGISHGEPFAAIDTENGRMLHYADEFPEMRHGRLDPPHSPDWYSKAIAASEQQGFPVTVVDSMSHEWIHCLEWHDEIMGDDAAKSGVAWIKPKMAHKAMVMRLLQAKSHIIMCFRAEPKIEFVKDDRNRTVVREKVGIKGQGLDGWFPITQPQFPFEMTASFLLMADAPGMPKPIKLQEQHRPFVPLNEPLSEETGRLFANWSAGGQRADLRAELTGLLTELGRDDFLNVITEQQWQNLSWVARQIAAAKAKLSERASVPSPEDDTPQARSGFTVPEGVQ